MALQYFMAHSGVKAELKEKATDLLERGYKKLISYETKGGGYEWFGGTPAHEGLTAYGILQVKVHPSTLNDLFALLVGYSSQPIIAESKSWNLPGAIIRVPSNPSLERQIPPGRNLGPGWDFSVPGGISNSSLLVSAIIGCHSPLILTLPVYRDPNPSPSPFSLPPPLSLALAVPRYEKGPA